MYLSRLTLNTRSRQAMSEITRPYQLHRTLMRAFPDADNGGPGRVLFRLDTPEDNECLWLLVQSEKKPAWGHHEALRDYLQAPPECKEYTPSFTPDQTLHFRLRANPTMRVKQSGKRQGVLGEERQLDWLKRKGLAGGFELLSVTVIDEDFKRETTPSKGYSKLTLLSVRYEGVLRVRDPERFGAALATGIGNAKGFGFGLLSVARLRDE